MNTISRNTNVSLGRNDPCPCGSGKKYKKCCGSAGLETPASPPAPSLGAELRRLARLAAAGHHLDLEGASQELLARYPQNGVLWKFLGVALWAQGKDALKSMQRSVELLPDDAEAHSNLGGVLRAHGQLEDAVRSYRRALDLNPGYAESHNNLGGALQDMGLLEEAAQSFRRATALKPDFALAHGNLGNVLSLLGRGAECEASCRRALELNPNLTAAIVQMAEAHAGRGEFNLAEELLRRAIAVEPDMPEAWAGLARLRKMGAADADWLAAVQRIVRLPLAARREVHLRYALGKYFDDRGDYAQAFDNYRRANELARVGRRTHDREQFRHGMDRIIQTFDADWLRRANAAAIPSELPVFIVGLPRSGTTLTEQILASHATVFGGGELTFWNAAAGRYANVRGRHDELETLRMLAQEYTSLLEKLSGGAARVIDKMPANFLYLGMIHAALPNARIIHIRRHPIDTCLSIYFQNFDTKHTYANDLGDLAHYYREYLRIMDHWRQTLPPQTMLDVPYEALVADVEQWSRRMVDFIGLAWDPNCLEFHRSERTIDTASKWQVRQTISLASIERWRHYEKFVGPLRALIESDP